MQYQRFRLRRTWHALLQLDLGHSDFSCDGCAQCKSHGVFLDAYGWIITSWEWWSLSAGPQLQGLMTRA